MKYPILALFCFVLLTSLTYADKRTQLISATTQTKVEKEYQLIGYQKVFQGEDYKLEMLLKLEQKKFESIYTELQNRQNYIVCQSHEGDLLFLMFRIGENSEVTFDLEKNEVFWEFRTHDRPWVRTK